LAENISRNPSKQVIYHEEREADRRASLGELCAFA
jgi:hypothetical protein